MHIIPIYIYIYIIYSLFSLRYFVFLLYFVSRDTHFYGHLFFIRPSFLDFCFIFNQYLPILLMFTNIISFSFLLHPHPSRVCFVWPFRATVLEINRATTVLYKRNILLHSGRYAQNFIGYPGITVAGYWIRKMAHDKFADVSRCLDSCAPRFPGKATLEGICHGNGSKA